MTRHGRAVACLGLALLAGPARAKDAAAPRAEARNARAAATPDVSRHGASAPEPPPPAERAPAPAEPPPSDLTEQAKQLYLLGAEAFTAQRNADAIYYFRQAQRLVPSAKLTYNIALAYDEMGDTGNALREYRAFLTKDPGSVHREEASARVAKLEADLAQLGVQQLRVVSDPPGALLRVDAELVGVTPWVGELPPGQHELQLEHAGRQTLSSRVTLSALQASDVQLTLSPLPAPPPEQPSGLSRIQPLSWAFLGVGVATLAGGIGFELSRAASSERAGQGGSAESVARAQGAAAAKQMASLLLLGAGGAFVVGGGVMIVLDLKRGADTTSPGGDIVSDARLRLPCAREFCGFVTEARF
ncbi:MAG TPA: PEGA domain-containing protein [Polyangiaceae bacterium]|nr:PEGA domain-containing protein [Polyangiaceae bacterium]